MTRIVVKSLIWDEWNMVHIQKHSVTQVEIIETVGRLAYHRITYNNRYLLVGRSGNRIITVIVRREKETEYYIVTARDANKKERRRLYEKEKKFKDT